LGVPAETKLLAAVIPVYHGVAPMLEDLLDSLDAYLGRPYHAIVVDDGTTDGTAEALGAMEARRANLSVLRNERTLGWGWGVYQSLGKAARWALEHLEFDALLKLDHDSLVIGPGLGTRLGALFAEPEVGLVGCLQPEPNRWIWDWRVRPEVKRAALGGGY
jgi:GT2 family glycosyltransferase